MSIIRTEEQKLRHRNYCREYMSMYRREHPDKVQAIRDRYALKRFEKLGYTIKEPEQEERRL